jgi:hypothetical protein
MLVACEPAVLTDLTRKIFSGLGCVGFQDFARRCCEQMLSPLRSIEAPVPFDSSMLAWVTIPVAVETIAVILQNGE